MNKGGLDSNNGININYYGIKIQVMIKIIHRKAGFFIFAFI
jgi:hypothetical protein